MYVKTLLRKRGKGDALVGIGWSTARTPLTLSLALQKAIVFTLPTLNGSRERLFVQSDSQYN